MKKSKQQSGLELSEYLARSQKGLWVKGERTEEAIDIFWKPRFDYDRGMVTVFDFNGDVEETVHGSEIDWGDEWRLAGSIPLVDEMVVMSGLQHFDEFANSLMRHAVRLLTCGYGETPEEVIEWFSNFGERKFVVEDEYCITRSHGEFQDLQNHYIVVDRKDDGSLIGTINIRGVEFEFDLNDSEVFTSFVVATTPI